MRYRGKHRDQPVRWSSTRHLGYELAGATFITAMAALGVVSSVAVLNWIIL
jgi:hypothetical protein